jgi:hypothetical protein
VLRPAGRAEPEETDMAGWAKIAAAAAGGGGGSGGVTLNLNDLVVPVASNINDRLTESFTVNRPEPISVYPGSWSESDFQAILEADDVMVSWGDSLEWNMADDSWMPGDESSYALKCNFQIVHLPEPADEDELICPAGGLYLLHNVTPFAEVSDSGWGWNVQIDISYGQPYPASQGVTGIPVHWHVNVKEGDGDQWRDVTRSWAIQGDGQKIAL